MTLTDANVMTETSTAYSVEHTRDVPAKRFERCTSCGQHTVQEYVESKDQGSFVWHIYGCTECPAQVAFSRKKPVPSDR